MRPPCRKSQKCDRFAEMNNWCGGYAETSKWRDRHREISNLCDCLAERETDATAMQNVANGGTALQKQLMLPPCREKQFLAVTLQIQALKKNQLALLLCRNK
ncbi:hypothetical protein PoB_003635400 [Plakobranchus ocellatus]|uniref:Uncharacterized protein n=1 Tax=Plakobranchus ocellatus TaxID=259542 RepID=A0AAV4AU30_9GAST|nr:hypothetical protein PoB_003635400 [Plakobranchus ocellatus]